MWQKTAGSALLEFILSGKLMVGRVSLVCPVDELLTRIGLAKLLVSLEW